MGDKFENIHGSVIVNRSFVNGAVGQLESMGQNDQAEALAMLASAIEESGSADARELLNALTEELQKPAPRKTLLRSTWEALKGVLPAVAQVASVVGVIDRLVGP